MSRRVAIIGLGEMGSAFAARLLGRGFAIAGFEPDDRRARAAELLGVELHPTPASAAAAADDVVILIVATGEQALDACGGRAGCMPELSGKVLLVMSSLDPKLVRRLDDDATGVGGATVDAPSAGGAPAARNGALTIMAAGSTSGMALAAPVLGELATTIELVGDAPGAGQAAKLITQLALAANLTATVEAVRIGASLGLDAASVLRSIAASSGSSFVAQNFDMLSGLMTEHHVGNILKDLRTLLDQLDGGVRTDLTEQLVDALPAAWPRRSELKVV